MNKLKKLFIILYFKVSYIITEKLDIHHIIVYIIAFIGGYLTALFIFEQNWIFAIFTGVVSASLNELFRKYFKNEPDVVIITQANNESDEEFMKKIGNTIHDTMRSIDDE
ncbi:MAG: hypothetical protein ACOCRK_05460 [bacterium]